MNLGEKFADAWFNYREKTDEETLPSLLSEDFQWETITKTRINDKIFESKQDTLNTLSAIKAKATKSIFFSSDEMLVFATNFILEILLKTKKFFRFIIISKNICFVPCFIYEE